MLRSLCSCVTCVCEQSSTWSCSSHRVRISRTVSNKTAKLIRVSYWIAAGARTHQQGGSLLEQGLGPASSSWRMASSSLCAALLSANTAWAEWEWWTGTQIIWAEVTSEEENRAKKSKREAFRGEKRIWGQSRGKVMGAERWDPAQRSLCVCAAELLLLPHLLHHLDRTPTHHPLLTHSPSLLLSFYLPVVPFNNAGACWYAEQRWRVWREELVEGGIGGGRGEGTKGLFLACVGSTHVV